MVKNKKTKKNLLKKEKFFDSIKIKSFYTKDDLKKLKFINLNNDPGKAPFLRGVYKSMYLDKPWTIRQYAGFSTVEDSNKFYKKCLKAGQTGLSVAFDLPTHRGYDSDDSKIDADIGKAGVAVDSVEDMKILFKNIPLDKVSVSMTMNGAVLPILANFIVAAEEQGVNISKLRGTIQNDILKEFMVRNTYIYPPDASMRIVADVIDFVSKKMPKFNSISVSGYHMHEAGATAVQELAYTLSNGIEYIKAAKLKKQNIDKFAPQLSFFFAIGMNFFLEIAKLRAARVIWAKTMKKLGAKKESSCRLRVHCQTSGVSLTQRDPYNNIVRTSYEALSAVLGGTQSLHTNSFDEAIGLPTEFSSTLARNTQLILQEETSIPNTVDPLAGSYLVESLTDSLIQESTKLMTKIEELGGMTRAVSLGIPKLEIENSATAKQAKIDNIEQVVVGLNKYISNSQPQSEPFTVDNFKVKDLQIKKLKALRSKRNDQEVLVALNNLREGIKSNKNLLELSINAARAKATVGEITSAMESIFGRHTLNIRSVSGVYSRYSKKNKNFIKVRNLVKKFSKQYGKKPKILVTKLGQDGHDRGAKLIATAFRDIGFDVKISKLFQTPEEIALMAIKNKVHIVGVSTLAAGHKSLVPQLMAKLRELKFNDVKVVVGGIVPQKDHQYLTKHGVSAIFGPGTEVAEAASKVLNLVTNLKSYHNF